MSQRPGGHGGLIPFPTLHLPCSLAPTILLHLVARAGHTQIRNGKAWLADGILRVRGRVLSCDFGCDFGCDFPIRLWNISNEKLFKGDEAPSNDDAAAMSASSFITLQQLERVRASSAEHWLSLSLSLSLSVDGQPLHTPHRHACHTLQHGGDEGATAEPRDAARCSGMLMDGPRRRGRTTCKSSRTTTRKPLRRPLRFSGASSLR